MGAKLSLTLGDDFGRTTKRVYGMETEALLATYLTNITAFVTALAAVTDLSLIKANISIAVTGEEFAVTSDANIDRGAKASGWLDTTEPKKASARIPGIKLTLVSSDGSMPITGAVATFLAMFETGADFNLSDGEQIDTWIRGTLDK